jgi:hypothetical protein
MLENKLFKLIEKNRQKSLQTDCPFTYCTCCATYKHSKLLSRKIKSNKIFEDGDIFKGEEKDV